MLKKIIILILALGLIAGGVLLFFYKPANMVDMPTDSVDVQNFFPDGDSQTNTGNTSSGEDVDENANQDRYSELSEPVALLKQIYKDPISGAGITQSNKKDFLRFIDKATGHIYEAPLDTFVANKISNTTIPKVAESVWTQNGTGVILRYVKSDNRTIESFYTKLATATTTGTQDGAPAPQTLEGSFLPQNITSLTSSPQKTSIASVSGNSISGGVIFESNPDGSKIKEVARLPLKELLVYWPKQDTIAIATKPSFGVEGFLFFLNRNTGTINTVLSKPGLTVLVHPNTSKFLYSEGRGGLTASYIYTISTKKSEILPVQTLPEKCVWSSIDSDILYCAVPTNGLLGNLPDTWYQGVISFSDEIWEINLDTGTTRRLVNPKNISGQDIDAINLFTNSQEDYLFFTNKKDDSLWGLRLRNTSAQEE